MKSVFQYLNGLWGHTLTDQVFETEDEAAVDYEAEARKRT